MHALADPGFVIPFALVQAALLLLVVWALDVYEREPLGLVGLLALWGATAAPALALTVRTPILEALPAGSAAGSAVRTAMYAAIVEEPAKGVALVAFALASAWLAKRSGTAELEGAIDGLVYGAAVGLGFAFTEDVFSFAQQATVHDGLDVFVRRADLLGISMATHAVYTGLFGAALGIAVLERTKIGKAMLYVLGLGAAILLHAAHNGLDAGGHQPARRALDYLMVLGFVGIFVVWNRREQRTIRAELAEEVASGLISPAQAASASTYGVRLRRKLAALRSTDWSELRTAEALDAELTDLALAKWRAHALDEPLDVDHRRAAIRRLAATTGANA